ncbi:FMN-binding negative transcriptional regulator [Massilia sp. DWR3-1-1]|uniref:FMN-binding negative transcriptional regulator n=1 Tax=Massilia sp. DWR3-1-1 TaxID=2804559 RepID=UPI003CF40BE9
MYTPSHFDETRPAVLAALIDAHPLGAIITHGAAGLGADHIPFEYGAPTPAAPWGTLRAHVARANPLWRQDGHEVMVLFQGAHGYISPSLYEEKPLSGKVVPTWNYAVVHGHGVLRAVDDPAWLLALLERLTARHEGARAAPWALADAPPAYIATLVRALVGIEIVLTRLDGKWKLSQNRSPADQLAIAAELPALQGQLPA